MSSHDDGAGRSTREALMEAALDHVQEHGVLAGLNLREVADAVGVTPANIYHYFGSRQGLLRAALNHEVQQLLGRIDVAVTGPYVDWRVGIFDLALDHPSFRTTALLALDGDPDYEPFALYDLAQEHYQRLIDEGGLPEDFDVVAGHLLSLSMAVGVAIYGDAVARQVGIDPVELRARARALFVTLTAALVPPGREGPAASPDDEVG